MNKRQAKAYVLRCLAAEARHHEGNASEWLERPVKKDGIRVDEDGNFNEADRARIVTALDEITDELETRAARLSRARRKR